MNQKTPFPNLSDEERKNLELIALEIAARSQYGGNSEEARYFRQQLEELEAARDRIAANNSSPRNLAWFSPSSGGL